jgi:hypothetical protein
MSFNDLERGLRGSTSTRRPAPGAFLLPRRHSRLLAHPDQQDDASGSTDGEHLRAVASHCLSGVAADRAFSANANRIALDVFKMDSNVAGISKLVDLLGTPKDNASLRKKLCVTRLRGLPAPLIARPGTT